MASSSSSSLFFLYIMCVPFRGFGGYPQRILQLHKNKEEVTAGHTERQQRFSLSKKKKKKKPGRRKTP